MKKLVFIGAVALVLLGCVIAAGCTSTPTTQQTTSKDNALSLPVGEWICTKYTTDEGKTVTAIQTIKADGTGYWMDLNDSNPGFQLDRIYKSNFSKPDQNGAFEKVSSSGNTRKMVYDAAKGTITQSGKNVYTRLDPIVGIWSGNSALKNGTAVTNIFKPDGTGITVTVFENSSVAHVKLTWKKNTDGTYAVDFNNETKQIYTVASDGKTLKTDDGRTKTKQFLDTTFLVSVTGPWYNKEKNALTVFNADGTGFIKSQSIFPFTWKLTDIGKFTVTYTDGIGVDGTSLKGKTFEWTYDRDNNVFSSSTGTKYIRPNGEIEGKINSLA